MNPKYNLVIVTPDQLRQDYLGCYGSRQVKTPNIDALAKEGIRFDNCYCAAPLCGPSRISFTTSTYFSEHNHRNYGSTISPSVPNLVTELKKKGYYTGMFGKNHLFTYSELPKVWDELDEICLGNYDGHEQYVHSYSSFTLNPEHPFNITGRLTDEAVSFVEKNQNKPFFLWINYQDPHPAFTCPPPYDTMYAPESIEIREDWQFEGGEEPVRNKVWRAHSEMDSCSEREYREAVAHYMGQITYVDDSLGRIVDSLKQNGLEKKTIILFFSDHGELLGSHHMMHKIPVFYDCLTKIPVILYHPEKYHGISFKGLVEEVDLVPTLLEMLQTQKQQAAIPPTMVGRSLCSLLEKGCFDKARETVLCEAGGGAPTWKEPKEGMKLVAPFAPTSFDPGAMLRRGSYKLSIYHDDRGELYCLDTDPMELHNLYEDPLFADIRQELTLELLKRLLGVKVRDTESVKWNYSDYDYDVRFEPLERTEV